MWWSAPAPPQCHVFLMDPWSLQGKEADPGLEVPAADVMRRMRRATTDGLRIGPELVPPPLRWTTSLNPGQAGHFFGPNMRLSKPPGSLQVSRDFLSPPPSPLPPLSPLLSLRKFGSCSLESILGDSRTWCHLSFLFLMSNCPITLILPPALPSLQQCLSIRPASVLSPAMCSSIKPPPYCCHVLATCFNLVDGLICLKISSKISGKIHLCSFRSFQRYSQPA